MEGMPTPRSAKKLTFPFRVEKNGRTGKVYRLGNGTFKSYFRFSGAPKANTHATFDGALEYLNGEFVKLDSDRENALSLSPLNGDVRMYSELEHLLREKGAGATLREAVAFYLAHHANKKFQPNTVSECATAFVESQRTNNASPPHVKTLEKHFRRFKEDFGTRKIHEITALEITAWLGSQRTKKRAKDEAWSAKTRRSVRGSLVSLSIFAQEVIRAIPEVGRTEFQKVRNPKAEERGEVAIYTPDELKSLFTAAPANDIVLIPALVVGNFLGLRPYEFHAEGLKRTPLKWEAFNWEDGLLHVTGQKIRSKATRDIPLNDAAKTWLAPFRELTGPIWKHKKAYEDKVRNLRTKAGVPSIQDGFRHSFASYRIRLLKGSLPELAQEMGNSPRGIIDSYKRNVTDAQAEAWFSLKPPTDYSEQIQTALSLRKTS
jgi:integrase